MNEALRARLRGIREILMAQFGASALLPDAAKGSERETLVWEFLQRVFPVPYRFGSGAIADAAGQMTGQLDVVVEFPFFASFPAPGGGERLYVAESVACVGEVKSNLAAQWAQVEDHRESAPAPTQMASTPPGRSDFWSQRGWAERLEGSTGCHRIQRLRVCGITQEEDGRNA